MAARDRGRRVAALMAAALANRVVTTNGDELEEVLLRSGAGPLAWWATRREGALRDAYRVQVMRAELAERELERLFRALDDAAIDVILGKGWSVARHYPDPGLRPYGDFDLFVAPEHHARLREVLAATPLEHFSVDVHRGAQWLDDRPFDDLLHRSMLVPLRGTHVRVFAPEDSLRLVCLHALGEGVLRPVWLCDIAVLLRDPIDDQRLCEGDARRTSYALAAIALARELLGDGPRVRPRWLANTVLRAWGDAPVPKGSRMKMQDAMRFGTVRHALAGRWPNAIEATVGVGGAIDRWPRFPYQLADAVRRAWGFTRRDSAARSS